VRVPIPMVVTGIGSSSGKPRVLIACTEHVIVTAVSCLRRTSRRALSIRALSNAPIDSSSKTSCLRQRQLGSRSGRSHYSAQTMTGAPDSRRCPSAVFFPPASRHRANHATVGSWLLCRGRKLVRGHILVTELYYGEGMIHHGAAICLGPRRALLF
jgi:hypothetical protein